MTVPPETFVNKLTCKDLPASHTGTSNSTIYRYLAIFIKFLVLSIINTDDSSKDFIIDEIMALLTSGVAAIYFVLHAISPAFSVVPIIIVALILGLHLYAVVCILKETESAPSQIIKETHEIVSNSGEHEAQVVSIGGDNVQRTTSLIQNQELISPGDDSDSLSDLYIISSDEDSKPESEIDSVYKLSYSSSSTAI